MSIRILQGDCRGVLKTLPDQSVHMVCTSPPYWGLRDYGTGEWEGGDPKHQHDTVGARGGRGGSGSPGKQTDGAMPAEFAAAVCSCGARRIDRQIGMEQTPADYVAQMVDVFREVWRVLRDDGTLWLNLGDGYNNFRVSKGPGQAVHGRDKLNGKPAPDSGGRGWDGLKEKDLMMMPARVALALQADGWTLRSDIIWAKRNCMPESVRDRPTTAHEHVFLLTKGPKYFYDATAIEEDAESDRPDMRLKGVRTGRAYLQQGQNGYDNSAAPSLGVPRSSELDTSTADTSKRNKRSVWWIATQPFAEAHFATFPPALIEPCILAGTSERGCCRQCGAPWVRQTERDSQPQAFAAVKYDPDDPRFQTKRNMGARDQAQLDANQRVTTGWLSSCSCNSSEPVPATVLDPFGGAGTTALVCDRLQRDAILIELNADYAAMAERRIRGDAGLFAEVG